MTFEEAKAIAELGGLTVRVANHDDFRYIDVRLDQSGTTISFHHHISDIAVGGFIEWVESWGQ